MLLVFATTLVVSSILLFGVQPMFAKMVLPALGGSPAVWNTCMVFFQAMLLAGYGYVHATTAKLGVRRQAAMHVSLLFLPLFILPISIPAAWAPPAEQNPVPWLLLLLLMALGLPFFIVSTSAPMLQKWFVNTGHWSSKDPYFLYAASNFGSMVALLSYPALIEPNLRLENQSSVWAVGYGLLILLTLACTLMVWRSSPTSQGGSSLTALESSPDSSPITDNIPNITPEQRIRWVIWSFIPSSLMLGVTTHLTTDLSPIPLFWVIPLALYLLSFVLVFARKSILPHNLMVRLMPFAVLSLVLSLVLHMHGPLWLLITLHLITFLVVALVYHGELARSRPPVRHLTEFYLWMSTGGVLGGLFNALIAPMIFNSLIEYPLVLVLASLLRPGSDLSKKVQNARWLDFILPLALGTLVVGFVWGMNTIGLKPGLPSLVLMYGVPLLLCFSFRNRPIRFGLGVGAIMLASAIGGRADGRVLNTARSFFGVYRVELDHEEKYHLLIHAHISHGQQSLDPSRAKEPLSYYYRTGPIGQVFQALSEIHSNRPVAIVGLGTGSLACYGAPGQQFTFYEIDPIVERIARDPRYFTYLRDCPPRIEVILGDARLSLWNAPNGRYGLLVLDAFSSDAIPIHLLTREAIKLYLSKLADDGVLAFHISNGYLDLRPVMAALARDLGLACLGQDDLNITEAESKMGKAASQWVVLARQSDHLSMLAHDPRWKLLPSRPDASVWTDDFSNVLSIIRWK